MLINVCFLHSGGVSVQLYFMENLYDFTILRQTCNSYLFDGVCIWGIVYIYTVWEVNINHIDIENILKDI